MATPDNRQLDTPVQIPRVETGNTIPKDSAEKFLGTNESMASSPHTFHNALIAAKEFILKNEGSNAQIRVDTTNNPEAARWKQEASRLKDELQDPNVKQLFESKAANNPGEINMFLERKGFSIRLRDGGEGLYVASVFKQKVEWQEKGKKVDLNFMDIPSKKIEGVEIKKGNVLKYNYQGKEIYELATKNGDKVYMMPVSDNIKSTPIDLYQKIRKIHESKGNGTRGNDLRFPKVDLNESGSIDWIVGAKVGNYTVNQAEYQNKLQMDENGAVAEAAVAMGMSKSLSVPRIDTINGPMYVWFVKPGANGNDVITFAARVGESAMVKAKPN